MGSFSKLLYDEVVNKSKAQLQDIGKNALVSRDYRLLYLPKHKVLIKL